LTIYYPDLSNNDWSPGDDIASWLNDCIFNEGYSAICHKVTEGASFQDAYWGTVHAWCANNNVPLIGYHFVNTDDPAAQAANWVNWVGWEVPCMLDFEAGSTNPRRGTVLGCRGCVQQRWRANRAVLLPAVVLGAAGRTRSVAGARSHLKRFLLWRRVRLGHLLECRWRQRSGLGALWWRDSGDLAVYQSGEHRREDRGL
jgi:hypothetical protein